MHDDPFARAVQRMEADEQAQKQSNRKRRQARYSEGNRTGFRIHATVFAAVNLLLIAIWFTTWQLNDATSYPWFMWVLLGWGVGLAAHYAAARNHLKKKPASADNEATAGLTDAEQLAQLSELHRAGSLSDEEFGAAKAKLLT